MKVKKMRKILKNLNEKKHNIFILTFILLFFVTNFFNVKYKENSSSIIIAFTIICLICSLLFYIFHKKFSRISQNNIPKLFVITAFFLGIIFLFASPLFTGSDEHNHYYRIYEITEGTFITPTENQVGSKLPKSLHKVFLNGGGHNTKIKYDNIKDMFKEKLENEQFEQYGLMWSSDYSNTALYSPASYVPQVIGFFIGKTLNLNPYIIGILGRIINLITYVIIGYFCLKIIPKYSFYCFLILISPNMISLATTLSADAFTIMTIFLFISIIIKIKNNSEKIEVKTRLLLIVLSILISLCKIVYFPFVFFLFFLPKEIFKKKIKEKNLFIIITILISFSLSLLWIKTTEGIFLISYDKSELQRAFILSNPIEYFTIFFRSYASSIINYIDEIFVGSRMYHSQVKISIIISITYIILVIKSLEMEKENYNFSNVSRFIIVNIILIIIVLISTAIYVQNTAQYFSVGNSIITGIQGRYFIPLLFFIPFIIKKPFSNHLLYYDQLYKYSLAINIVVLFHIFAQFIV